jgi:hypothetical protein
MRPRLSSEPDVLAPWLLSSPLVESTTVRCRGRSRGFRCGVGPGDAALASIANLFILKLLSS